MSLSRFLLVVGCLSALLLHGCGKSGSDNANVRALNLISGTSGISVTAGGVTIRAAGGSVPEREWEITTGDGSITLELPETFNADLDAHTGDGGISVHDLTVSNVSGKIGKNTLRGQLGSGGPLVRLRTGDGAITLKRALAAERTAPQ